MALEAFIRPERGSDPPSGIRRRSDLLARRSELTLLAESAQNSSNLRELGRLVQRLRPAVERTCRGVLGPRHTELEDAAQDCLLEILRALPNYRFQGDFLHYTNKICLRVALLAKRRERERSDRFEPLEGFAHEPAGATQSELDRARALRRVLFRLPRAQAEALSLHFVAGYSVEEAAELTQVSPNTVKTRIRLGKRRLRKKLRGLDAELMT
ncbi:MAG TPA: sigma-70 family RNA polymerase sigma factor [Polyangiaceae bacterium]